ncbi:Dbl-like domain-containing protein [Melanogaster broomeanus]|nr:Dbl-like domain-containing protein [Melanogaster broomeanus]
MKAFLNRFNRGPSKDSKEKEKDRERNREREKDRERDKDKDSVTLPPLPEWPPSQVSQSRTENKHDRTSAGTPSSVASIKPLPDLTARPLPPIEEPNDADSDSGVGLPVSAIVPTPADHPEPTVKYSARKAVDGSVNVNPDIQKKVAFISPPPTPSGPSTTQPLPDTNTSHSNSGSPSQAAGGVPLKTTLSRFQATHGKDTRGSTATAASSSRTDLGSKSTTTTNTTSTGATSTTLTPTAAQSYSAKATSTRTVVSPYPGSVRSGTPYSQMSNASTRILAVSSWSEGAEDDLVSNLGPRERTRQEVLWEIVASEERYVNDLQKMKESFIDPLLHPYAAPPPTSPTPYDCYDYVPTPTRADLPQESIEALPIASRFMSPTGFRSEGASALTPETKSLAPTTPIIDDESAESDLDDGDQLRGLQSNRANLAAKHSHPRSPYRAGSAMAKIGKSVPFPSRSHASLPAPQRMNQANASSHSLGRQSVVERERDRDRDRDRERKDSSKTTPTMHSRLLRKPKRSQTQPEGPLQGAVPPHLIPEDLRICLEVIESGVLDGHVKLSEGLKKRYDEQYPLVRSLADVFVSSSHIFQGYATYVLHLERALEQVDNALSTASAAKKPKNQDAIEWLKVCKSLQRLEELAAEKAETGLAITLSKPFQRLLKYPLLFQNLLFHTDPSTFEYESTLQMVSEVETIVRSIEDEKIQKEDRDKTRDVLARIEGLDKVKQLAIPKPSRLLLEERQLLVGRDGSVSASPKGSSPPPVLATKNVKGKTSFRRLSDVLGSGSGMGGKKDLWLVVFNDVVLRCQRTGVTSLPLVSSMNSRTNSLPEMQGKSKYATAGRRSSHTKPRNLYKFIKAQTWAIGDVIQPKEGVVAMEDVVRSKEEAHSSNKPRIIPLPDDDEDGDDSDDSDKKSKMSFSYWGADKITLQKPILKPKQHSIGGTSRRISPGGTSYGRESSANAKFGSRLVSGEQVPSMRPASRRTQATPSTKTRVNPSDDTNSVKATVTRPVWDTSTRSQAANLAASKRPRQTSQTSTATRATTTPTNKPQLSPVASEDSAVGLYRQLITQDPSLTQ